MIAAEEDSNYSRPLASGKGTGPLYRTEVGRKGKTAGSTCKACHSRRIAVVEHVAGLAIAEGLLEIDNQHLKESRQRT